MRGCCKPHSNDEANAGDCKLDDNENLSRNLHQLKANITKTASICLLKAAEQGYVENLSRNLCQLKANIIKTASICLLKAAEQGYVCKKKKLLSLDF